MTRVLSILILISYSSLLTAQVENLSLLADSNYTLWLQTKKARTDQTSGIAFIKSQCDVKYFFLADDIGVIQLLTIKDDTVFSINSISFSDSVQRFINELPKADFEEIIYDNSEEEFYLSIEGTGEDFKKYVGIYRIYFDGSEIENYQIASLQKVIFTPSKNFLQYIDNNIGYEGVAIDENYFYLGLEGFTNNRLFADSTIIFIARKSDKKIIKEISTKNIGVHTICGLFSDENFSLWGIDRNNRKIFHINFDEELNIKTITKYDCSTAIPGYPEINYLPSFESITIDDENNLYLVDDPWKEMFIPKQEIFDKLDTETKNNFKEYVPTIFKYKIIHTEGDK